MTTKAWVDPEVLRQNRVSQKLNPPIVVEHSDGNREMVQGLTFQGTGRMVYDSKCTACASVTLQLDESNCTIHLER